MSAFLAACGSSASSATAVPAPKELVESATAVPEELAAESESEQNADSAPAKVAAVPGFPAKNVQEASIVRDRDWTKGTDDPLVTIIEYGDFQ
ncbi:MAG: hypothetical protein GWP17_02495 [Aquificales bacterium]|nr:hypothetical protein [Aquificales bacterium]